MVSAIFLAAFLMGESYEVMTPKEARCYELNVECEQELEGDENDPTPNCDAARLVCGNL